MHRRIAADHHVQTQFVATVLRQGRAHQPAAFPNHEIDQFGRNHLSRADHVALVFAVLVVDDQHDFTRPNVGDGVFDTIQLNGSRPGRGYSGWSRFRRR